MKILSSGGEATTIKKPLSWGGDTSYIGEVVTSFILSDVTGKVESSDVTVEFGSLYYRLGSDQKNLKITEALIE